jgi:hypothetical protein
VPGDEVARIDHYEFGRIVVDGRQESRDLIALPDWVVRNWWRQDGHALVLDDLAEVLDELSSHLVVGTGADGRMRPDPDTIRPHVCPCTSAAERSASADPGPRDK